ncbi:unnamed protein product, partial [Heterotrigona itama]
VVCVKCARAHDTKDCNKALQVPATCTNCRGNHPVNYLRCPALLAFPVKKNKI